MKRTKVKKEGLKRRSVNAISATPLSLCSAGRGSQGHQCIEQYYETRYTVLVARNAEERTSASAVK